MERSYRKLQIGFSICTTVAILLSLGCVDKNTIRLSQDIALVQQQTSDSLVASINEELKEPRSESEKQALINLRNRLDYLKRANNALAKSLLKDVTPEEIAKLITEAPK